MKLFAGFPQGKTRFTPIPDLFFTELLENSDDLAELKLTLYLFWSLNRQRGYPRYLTLAELESEGSLLSALRNGEEGNPLDLLHEAVDRAVARGTLLRLNIAGEEEQADYLFLNTPQGRKAIAQVQSGELVLETTGYMREAHVKQDKPRIYELYEQNIGLLQPLLADELAEAEQSYPADWIEDAFRIAVEDNVRKWRYIRSILERWAHDGKDDGRPASAHDGHRASYLARKRKL
jgi:DNA replication protein